MQLYRILLVDDEEEVRQSIAQKIDWQQLGFEMVGQAENGQDAVQKIEQLMPDVVFTDISMPFMNGIELATWMKKYYPSIKVVLFSGHDEFEYAKKAIALNVMDYILKPINKEELSLVFEKLHKFLDEEINQKRNIFRLREVFAKNLPVLKQRFLLDLVHGKTQAATVNAQMKDYEIDLLRANSWVCFKVEIDISSEQESISLHSEKELVALSVKQLIEEKMLVFCKCVTFGCTDGICGIAALENQLVIDLVTVLADICRMTNKILAVNLCVGVGNATDTLVHLSTSYQQANTALGFKAMQDMGNVIYINDVRRVKTGNVRLQEKSETEYFDAIKQCDLPAIKKAAEKMADEMLLSQLHQSQYQLLVLDMFKAVYTFVVKYDIAIADIFENENNYFKMLAGLTAPQLVSNWLYTVGEKITSQLKLVRETAGQSFVLEAKHYILENYTNSELSLENVCSILHISPTYFSAVFKKETGTSYINFVTDLRMQKAVELLNTTDEKTYIIAEKIGYSEPNYFGYVFKKQFGISPAKFRQR